MWLVCGNSGRLNKKTNKHGGVSWCDKCEGILID